jgi:HK97 family phage major capsid protein
MSEEQILEKAAVTGVIASGGVGGVATPASQLGPVGTAKPSDGGGILNAEQSAQFIEYIFEQQVLARDGRRVTMRGNTAELEKLNVGERVIRAAAQADASYTNAGVTFTKVEITTKKVRLDWEVSSEALEDNIEGAGLEDHLVRTMTRAFANDLED